MVPAHALAIAIALRVAMWGRGYVPWLRLTAWAALAGHPVAFFCLSYPRYRFVTWFLTLVVFAVWLQIEGLDLLRALAGLMNGSPRIQSRKRLRAAEDLSATA